MRGDEREEFGDADDFDPELPEDFSGGEVSYKAVGRCNSGKRLAKGETMPHLIGNRVDWLTLGVRMDLADDFLAHLRMRGMVAEAHGAAPFEWHGWHGHLSSSKRGVYQLRNESHAIRIVERAPGQTLELTGERVVGWNVEIVITGSALMKSDWLFALGVAMRAVCRFGAVRQIRVRRLDLCADFEHLNMQDIDPQAFVKRSRAKLRLIRNGAPDFDFDSLGQLYMQNMGELETISIAPGGAVSCRIYNKSKELDRAGAEEKFAAESFVWTANRWGGGDVTRVEFQFSGEALAEMSARDWFQGTEWKDCGVLELADLRAEKFTKWMDQQRFTIGGLWGYGTDSWLYLVDREDDERLCRCAIDDRWVSIRRVDWGVRETIFRKRRERGGARALQVYGSVVSLCAKMGVLPTVPSRQVTEFGEVLESEREIANHIDTMSHEVIVAMVDAAFNRAKSICVDELVQSRGSSKEALGHMMAKWNAAAYRFRTVFDDTPLLSWATRGEDLPRVPNESTESGPFQLSFLAA